MPKTEALREILLAINPFLKIEQANGYIDESNAAEIFGGYPIVCEAFDRAENKAMLVNTLLEQTDAVIISASGMGGFLKLKHDHHKKVRRQALRLRRHGDRQRKRQRTYGAQGRHLCLPPGKHGRAPDLRRNGSINQKGEIKMKDKLIIGGHEFTSRFILGSGKYSLDLIKAAVEHAGAQIITLALRRAATGDVANIMDYIPKGVTLLPNTSGARNAEEAVRIARLAREVGCGDFIKIECIHESKYLLPDNYETIKATEILAKEGFVVLPYMYPDLNAARDLANAGAAAVMPLGAPIGSNKGLATREFIKILIDEIDLPIIVDAGIGKPSQACEAMEMGAAAVMANTAIATAGDIPAMAEAFKKAIEAGRTAYLSGMGSVIEGGARASSPLTGFLQD